MAVIDDLVSSGLSGTQATEVVAVGAGTGSESALVSQGFSGTQAAAIVAGGNIDELVRQGLFGTQATAVNAVVASGGGGGVQTYTLNTDYTYLSYVSFQGNRIDIRGVTNEGLRSAILALQIGGTLVMTTGGNSYTMTITTVFTEVSGVPNSYVASADSSPSAINFADYNTITV